MEAGVLAVSDLDHETGGRVAEELFYWTPSRLSTSVNSQDSCGVWNTIKLKRRKVLLSGSNGPWLPYFKEYSL